MYNAEELPDDIKQTIIAIRTKAANDYTYNPPTLKSLHRLRLDMEKRLEDKRYRIPVVQAITGLTITSTTNITQHYVNTIIEEMLDDRSTIIQYTEKLLKKQTGVKPWHLFPWAKPEVVLSDMFPDY